MAYLQQSSPKHQANKVFNLPLTSHGTHCVSSREEISLNYQQAAKRKGGSGQHFGFKLNKSTLYLPKQYRKFTATYSGA
jgi:hypothetical protein